MNAATAVAWPEKSSLPNVEERFWRDIDDLKARYSALWWETGTDTPVLGEAVGRRRQAENARETARLIDHLATQVESYPETEPERLAWRDTTRETVRRFGEERFGWPRGYRDLLGRKPTSCSATASSSSSSTISRTPPRTGSPTT